MADRSSIRPAAPKVSLISLPGESLIIGLAKKVGASNQFQEPLIAKDDLETGGNRIVPASMISVNPFKSPISTQQPPSDQLEEAKQHTSGNWQK